MVVKEKAVQIMDDTLRNRGNTGLFSQWSTGQMTFNKVVDCQKSNGQPIDELLTDLTYLAISIWIPIIIFVNKLDMLIH